MASPIDIANLALGWLGKKPITGFDDLSTEAQLVSSNYSLSRDAAMGSAEFTFGTKRFVLTMDPAGLVFGDQNKFLLPKEVIRVFTVNNQYRSTNSEGFRDGVPWQIEGRYILTTEQTAEVRAAVRVEDSETFSPEFMRSVAARLAADIAIPLTQSKKIEDAMENRYRMYLRDAKTQDGRQGTSKRLVSRWLDRARWSGGGGFAGPTV